MYGFSSVGRIRRYKHNRERHFCIALIIENASVSRGRLQTRLMGGTCSCVSDVFEMGGTFARVSDVFETHAKTNAYC